MADKKKKVRKPKKVSESSAPEEAPEEAPIVKKAVAKKAMSVKEAVAKKATSVKEAVAKKVTPSAELDRADVTLVGCAQLTKYGRKFIQGQTFPAFGKEQIEFFKTDKRFNVVEK